MPSASNSIKAARQQLLIRFDHTGYRPPGHDRRYAIDPARISSELGWSPRHDVEQGLAETVRWYLSHQDWCTKVRQSAGYDGSRLGMG